MRCSLCKTPTCDGCAAPYMKEDLRYVGMICKKCTWKRATSTDDLNELRKTLLLYFIPLVNLTYYIVLMSYIRYIFLSPKAWLAHYREGMIDNRKIRQPKPAHAYPLAFIFPVLLIAPLSIILLSGSEITIIGILLGLGYVTPALGATAGYSASLIVAKSIPEENLLCEHKPEAKSKLEKGKRKKKKKKKREKSA